MSRCCRATSCLEEGHEASHSLYGWYTERWRTSLLKTYHRDTSCIVCSSACYLWTTRFTTNGVTVIIYKYHVHSNGRTLRKRFHCDHGLIFWRVDKRFHHQKEIMFFFILITDYLGAQSRRTLCVWDAEVVLPVVSFFTLAHSIVRGRALLFHHSISLADVGAVQTFGQEVPELCEVFLRTRQTHGVMGTGAWRRHVRPRRAACTEQRVACIKVFVLKSVNEGHGGVSGHQEQKHGHCGQLANLTRKQKAVSLKKCSTVKFKSRLIPLHTKLINVLWKTVIRK